jgi:hypothetical protein
VTKPKEKPAPQPLQPTPNLCSPHHNLKPQNPQKQVASLKPTIENKGKTRTGDTGKPEQLQQAAPPSGGTEQQYRFITEVVKSPIDSCGTRARQQGVTIEGEKMKQEGVVNDTVW